MGFANMKIGTRLGIGFAVILLLLTAVVMVGLTRLNTINELSVQMVKKDWVMAEAANVMNATTRANARRTLELFIAPDAAYSSHVHDMIEKNKQVINEAVATLEKTAYTAESKELLAEIKTARAAYVASFSRVDQLIANHQNDAATRLVLAETLPQLDKLQTLVGTLESYQKTSVETANSNIENSVSFAQNLMLVVWVVALVIGVAFAWWVTHSITRPIMNAVAVAKTVASGDLTSNIDVDSLYETSQLLQALKDMNTSLVGIVNQVRTGTDTIATASAQIASGNLDLSSRTEEQASSLEETASSMEELTSTVKQNSENARHANQLAISASDIATTGGQVVKQVVNTMGSINDSAKKIVDIIGVIDGIAFQTNILALNAAVEAARAGEQGRGFAVVASEVRSLAQRSAAAAKEIKELIGNSVEKVDAGSKLVDEAGTTMQAIVDSIRHVTDIMGEITAASQEQTAGIEQINQAIAQMDEVTQQNAALVEEAAAASGALEDQAGKLAEVVSVFKITRQDALVAPAATQRLATASRAASNAAMPPPAVSTPLVRNTRTQQSKSTALSDDWEEF